MNKPKSVLILFLFASTLSWAGAGTHSNTGKDLASALIPAPAYNCSVNFLKGPHLGILNEGFYLKMDHVPSIYKSNTQELKKPAPFIWGAPNFRVTADPEVFGTGHPSLDGLKQVIHEIQEATTQNSQILWITYREEPVFFIKGEPFNMRLDIESWGNIPITGSNLETLQETEKLLKQAIIDEIKKNHGRLKVIRETAEYRNYIEEISAEPSQIQTLSELIAKTNSDPSQKIKIMRIPITDRLNPEFKDIDQIISGFKSCSSPDQVFLNSCHAGIGRTTTGLTGLIFLKSSPRKFAKEDLANLVYIRGARESVKKLESLLPQGRLAHAWADEVFESNNVMVSMRKDVRVTFAELKKLKAAGEPNVKAQELYEGAVKRYLTLIALAHYSLEQKPKNFLISFSRWLDTQPQVKSLLESPILEIP